MRHLWLLVGAVAVCCQAAATQNPNQVNLCRTKAGNLDVNAFLAKINAAKAAKPTTMSFLDHEEAKIDKSKQVFIRMGDGAIILPIGQTKPTTRLSTNYDPPATKATAAPSSPKPNGYNGSLNVLPGELDLNKDLVVLTTSTEGTMESTRGTPIKLQQTLTTRKPEVITGEEYTLHLYD